MMLCPCGLCSCSGHEGEYEFNDMSVSESELEYASYYLLNVNCLQYTNSEFRRNMAKYGRLIERHHAAGKLAERKFVLRFPGFKDNTIQNKFNIDTVHEETGVQAEIKLDAVRMRNVDATGMKKSIMFEFFQNCNPGKLCAGGPFRTFHDDPDSLFVLLVHEYPPAEMHEWFAIFKTRELVKRLIHLVSLCRFTKTRKCAKLLCSFSVDNLRDIMIPEKMLTNVAFLQTVK